MADPSSEIPLPPSVEEMLRKICYEQSQPPPNTRARRELASLSEAASLELLRKISKQRIRKTLDGFIIYMVREARPVSTQESVCFSQARSSSCSSPVNPRGTDDDADSHSPIPEHLIGSPSLSLERASTQTFSPQLVALGELEFRKAFLILSYIGRKRLDDVISADEIRRLQNFPMRKFESEVWNALGQQCSEEIDRLKGLDWDSGKTYIYHCHVYPDESYRFKGPYLENKRTHLQKVLGDENVLRVKFAEEGTDGSTSGTGSSNFNVYEKIAKEGILVGLRRYHFFVFKDGGKEEKKKNPTSSPVKCYFVCMDSNAAIDEKKPCILYKKTIHEARCLFMHAHTVPSVAKFMARFSLILSKTIKLDVNLASVHIERIDDVPCRDKDGRDVCNEDGKPLIHTDGTGFISEDLALKCPKSLYKGKYMNMNNENFERILDPTKLDERLAKLRQLENLEPPLLIQFRLFNDGCAVKGTLLVNRKLPPRTIQIRPSMIKVETDSKVSNIQTVNSLEIVATSNQPRKPYLSRHLIALLSHGGVPTEYFMDILMNALEDSQSFHSNKRAALKVSLNYGEMDDFTVARMILSGIPLDEPFLQYRLSFLMNVERKGLKGGRLPVSECYYLMGTADPTGMLNSDEVCIILGNGQISGKVLVYKNPGLHFGDIHVLNATYVKALEDVVGNAKYAIFFPTKGPRSLADEMANSDFDGDMYWVSRNPQKVKVKLKATPLIHFDYQLVIPVPKLLLLDHFVASKPWTHTYSTQNTSNKEPSGFSSEDLEHELFKLFLTTRFQPSRTLSVAADSWLAFMDRFLTLGDDCADEKYCLERKMLQLIDIYYAALDAPKAGIKVEVPKELQAEKFPHFMERINSYNSTSILGQIYNAVESLQNESLLMKEVRKLSCFDVEVPEACLTSWDIHYDRYRGEMHAALQHEGEIKDDCANEVIKKYKQILYGAAEFEESARKMEEIFDEALAIYQVTYNYAEKQGATTYCNFAWKVAGSALCKYYTMKQGEKSIVCLPSVLREVFS